MYSVALIHVSEVPFHLVAGPALEVFTTEPATEDFFSRILFEDEHLGSDKCGLDLSWWERQPQQSECGILLKVDYDNTENNTTATELLIYAARAANVATGSGLATPPRSSSPEAGQTARETESVQRTPNLKVYALPLDSRRLNSIQAVKESIAADNPPINEEEALFLPIHDICNPVLQAPFRKRRKLSTVFDDATHQRRRLKSRGGESVSRAMAEASIQRPRESSNTFSHCAKADMPQQSVDIGPAMSQKKGSSRSPNIVSLPNAEMSRPPSRRGTFVAGQRSSLSRVESVISRPDSPVAGKDDNEYEQQNKAALARIVMAGMRMYGLQQHKKSSKSKSGQHTLIEQSQQIATEETDEYKNVYHQTFKAASFAFRSHSAFGAVPQESMRDIVDHLLSLFCVDPFHGVEQSSFSAPLFGSQEEKAETSFNEPKNGPVEQMTIGTPFSRKKEA